MELSHHFPNDFPGENFDMCPRDSSRYRSLLVGLTLRTIRLIDVRNGNISLIERDCDLDEDDID